MPYTSNRGFSVQATGTNSGVWGSDGSTPTAGSSNALNQGVTQLLDQALGSTATLSLSSSTPITLTQAQMQCGMLRITGTLLASIVVQPDAAVYQTGFYCWENVTSGNFTVTYTNAAGSVVLPQGRRGLLWNDTTNGPRVLGMVGSANADPVPAGMTVTAYNSSTPAGYSIVAVNDFALQVVSSGAGVTSGSVAYSTLFARTATDGYTLTVADIPSHTHTYGLNNPLNASSGSAGAINAGNTTAGTTSATGGGGSHSHGLDMRVQTAKVSLVTRN